MRDLLLVGVGGFVGSVSRYYLSGLVLHLSAASRFPWATLAVNTLGCLAIGAIAGLAEHTELISPAARLFLLTGVLGGFTTFSAFGLETYVLGRGHLWSAAALSVWLHLIVALPAVWIGHRIATRLLSA
jgi:CrcB protein